MKSMYSLAIWVGAITTVVALVSRFTLKPIPLIGGMEAQGLLAFANTCFLVAVLIKLNK
ncbi:MAG: hypothetical protein KKE64_05750 [Candidatus Omnitrophica bacterium]|nr:hypothetical protein [Candidatus Omnitrophota bacterium]